MSERIFTLFGEEIVPEQMKAVGRSRAKKKPGDKEEETKEEATQAEKPEAEKPQAEAPQAEPPLATAQTVAEEVQEEEVSKEEEAPAKPEKEIIPPNWDGDKQYYSIGEVASLFNVKTSHIRFWTNEFKLKVRTTRKGDRLYTPEQIRELRAIHHLVKERGFTLTGAKAKLKAQNKMDVEVIDLKQSLLQLRNKLLTIRNQLVS